MNISAPLTFSQAVPPGQVSHLFTINIKHVVGRLGWIHWARSEPVFPKMEKGFTLSKVEESNYVI